MKNQKSRRLKRKTIKRKTIKRKQNKKIAYNQKMYGGKFNKQQEIILKQLLKKFDYSYEELESVIEKLGFNSQQLWQKHYFSQLIQQIKAANNKDGFNDWLSRHYAKFEDDVETDYENSSSDEDE
jgi:hypothetical protein